MKKGSRGCPFPMVAVFGCCYDRVPALLIFFRFLPVRLPPEAGS